MSVTSSCMQNVQDKSHPWHQSNGSGQKVARSLMPALSSVAQDKCCGAVEQQGLSLHAYLNWREAIIERKAHQHHSALGAYSPLLDSPPYQAPAAHQQLRGAAAMMACHPALMSTATSKATSKANVSAYESNVSQ